MTIYVLLISFFLYLAALQFVGVVAILVVKGLTVQLVCPFKHTGAGTLDWLFKSTTGSQFIIYTFGIHVVSFLPDELKQRLTVTGDLSIGEYHLNISGIRESDQGTYECLTGSRRDHQALIVIVEPTAVSIENVTPDNKVPGVEGQDMTIKCTAVGGQPTPDVKIVILGSTYTGTQSAQHTFKPQISDDGSTVTCQAGYTEINLYPLTTLAYIHLKFKPVIRPFAPDTMITEETKPVDVSCQSTGSRPAASMFWLLGQQRIDVTSNSTSQSNQESSTDTYSVTSNLKYRLDRRYNKQILICRASNVAGNMETYLTLNVKYAPGVTVENKTFSQTQSSRQIQSTLDSNPPVNSCKWYHRSKYGEYIRQFSDNNQILTLPTVTVDKRYQDTGEYVCTAENGIIGIHGQVKQTGSGYVISNAPPVITSDNRDYYTQYGKFGKSTELKVNVYSIPKYSRISWYIGNTQLVSNKYAIKEEPATVKDMFHGVDVQLNGYRVTLTISDLYEFDFTKYTLRLYYGIQYVQYEVTLESASAPETPFNFTITSSRETSITVQWIPGYDGGLTQTFYVQYRTSGNYTWVHQEIKTSTQLGTHNIYTLSGLQDKTSYDLRMYAKNKFNQSQHTDIVTTRTLMSAIHKSSNAVISAVAGVLVVSLIVCAIIISILIVKKRKGKKQTKKNIGFYENSGFQNVQIGDEYEEVTSRSNNIFVPDTQQKQTSKTYESLGTKDTVKVYDDLDNHKGLPSCKPSVDHYEALSAQDKPNLYEELENEKGQSSKIYVNEVL